MNSEPGFVDAGRGSPRRRIVLVVAAIAAAALGGLYLTANRGPSRDDAYLADLRDAGLRADFAADRQAIRFAQDTCEAIDNGGPAQGSDAARLAVEHYCDDYAPGFDVLETRDIDGTFTLVDFDSAADGCSGGGEGGYGDINSSTAVVLRNGDGDVLGRTSLGPAKKRFGSCEYTWTIKDITEGEKTYVLEIGDRGEISYEWWKLKAGPETSLG